MNSTDIACDIYLNSLQTCPYCGTSISPIYLAHYLFSDDDSFNHYHVICRCPKCYHVFFGTYNGYEAEIFPGETVLNVRYWETFPKLEGKTKFSEYINKISQQFVKIYNEAEIAEAHELNEIAGIGYRKAFEFLVKDYCISKYPEKEDSIKTDWLAKILKEYIEYEPLKNLAERVNWLGTDHGHYLQKYAEYGTKDLKYCIAAFINWIELLENTDKIIEDIGKR